MLSNQGVYFLEKYDELSESVVFGQKLRYFTGRINLYTLFYVDIYNKKHKK